MPILEAGLVGYAIFVLNIVLVQHENVWLIFIHFLLDLALLIKHFLVVLERLVHIHLLLCLASTLSIRLIELQIIFVDNILILFFLFNQFFSMMVLIRGMLLIWIYLHRVIFQIWRIIQRLVLIWLLELSILVLIIWQLFIQTKYFILFICLPHY